MPPTESVAMADAITRMFSMLEINGPVTEFWYVPRTRQSVLELRGGRDTSHKLPKCVSSDTTVKPPAFAVRVAIDRS